MRLSRVARVAFVTLLAVCGLAAQQSSGTQQLVLTLLPKGDQAPLALTPADVSIRVGNAAATVSAVKTASGDNGATEFYILFDRDSSAPVITSLTLLRNFVTSLPPEVHVGFGYLQDSGFEIVAATQPDHDKTASSLMIPEGGNSPSPFESMAAMVSQWRPQLGTRHEILVFTDAEAPVDPDEADNPLIRKLLPVFEQSGVVLYGVYSGGSASSAGGGGSRGGGGGASGGRSGRGGGGGAPTNAGPASIQANQEGYLKSVAEVTGGEVYWNSSLAPQVVHTFLDEIAARINHQYLVTYAPAPNGKPGPTNIKVDVKASGVQVTAPKSIVVQ